VCGIECLGGLPWGLPFGTYVSLCADPGPSESVENIVLIVGAGAELGRCPLTSDLALSTGGISIRIPVK
jgi:hypothetical protein